MKLTDVVELKSGTPQFRLIETSDPEAPVYCFYGQQELEADLTGMGGDADCAKRIRTHDAVEVLSADDLVFSLMSGKAALVSERHEGYLLTQNFSKLAPSPMIDARYLVYLLNEHKGVRPTAHSRSARLLHHEVHRKAVDRSAAPRSSFMGNARGNRRSVLQHKQDYSFEA